MSESSINLLQAVLARAGKKHVGEHYVHPSLNRVKSNVHKPFRYKNYTKVNKNDNRQ